MNGRSSSKPIRAADGSEDTERSQRVEFKVRTDADFRIPHPHARRQVDDAPDRAGPLRRGPRRPRLGYPIPSGWRFRSHTVSPGATSFR
jgi:hypothetical protein